jgi:hypothetical protein
MDFVARDATNRFFIRGGAAMISPADACIVACRNMLPATRMLENYFTVHHNQLCVCLANGASRLKMRVRFEAADWAAIEFVRNF